MSNRHRRFHTAKHLRRPAWRAFAGASRDMVTGGCLTVVAALIGGVAYVAGSAIEGTRRRIGPAMRGKEVMIYEGLIMGGLLVPVGVWHWTATRTNDAHFIVNQALGVKPPKMDLRKYRSKSEPKVK